MKSGESVESKEYYDKLASEYDYSASYTKTPWAKYFHLRRRIGSMIGEIEIISSKGKMKRALDVGCGDGVLLPALSKAAEKVIATDLSTERLDAAKKNTSNLNNIEYRAANIMDGDLSDENFDIITCSEVIEHVSNPEVFVEKLYNMLSPGGVLIISTPSKWSVREKYLRVQQIVLDTWFNKLRGKNLSKFKMFHIGLLTTSELASIAKRLSPQSKTRTVGFYVPVFTEVFFALLKDSGESSYEKLDDMIGGSLLSWLNWTQILVLSKIPSNVR